MTKISIWHYQRQLTTQLLMWSGLSMALGAALVQRGGFWRGFGAQAFGWGAIDALIAIGGRVGASKKQAQLPNPLDSAVQAEERHKLRRVLLVNAGLDVLYIASGLFTARRYPHEPEKQGHGWGVVVQGAFLLLFDSWHAWRLKE